MGLWPFEPAVDLRWGPFPPKVCLFPPGLSQLDGDVRATPSHVNVRCAICLLVSKADASKSVP